MLGEADGGIGLDPMPRSSGGSSRLAAIGCHMPHSLGCRSGALGRRADLPVVDSEGDAIEGAVAFLLDQHRAVLDLAESVAMQAHALSDAGARDVVHEFVSSDAAVTASVVVVANAIVGEVDMVAHVALPAQTGPMPLSMDSGVVSVRLQRIHLPSQSM